ncbi:MAG: carbohydrate kinase family protein [Oceanococcaceae bacterium]
MSALITGSMAYDTIMVYPGEFKDSILPDKVHMLNVAFLVPELRREFGGCAGNIAYNLHLLGGAGRALATVGADFAPYAAHWQAHGIDRSGLLEIEEAFTAQAFITTDLKDNQITAFHPGAMNAAHRQSIPTDGSVTLGTVSPDGREGMLQHAREFAQAGIPFLFDPGQGLPMFNGEELLQFIDQATWVAVNDYEAQMIVERTGLTVEALAERVQAFVVTRGGEGSRIHAAGRVHEIPAARPDAIVDPTGCGDAYRAGLLYGLLKGLDWERTGRIASLLGAIKIAHAGTQNHHVTAEAFFARLETAF